MGAPTLRPVVGMMIEEDGVETITVPPGLKATREKMSQTRNMFVRRGVSHDETVKQSPPLQAPAAMLVEGVSLT